MIDASDINKAMAKTVDSGLDPATRQWASNPKNIKYALGRLAYDNNVAQGDAKAYQAFLASNPEAQKLLNMNSGAAGYLSSNDLYNSAFARFRGDDIKKKQQMATEKAFGAADLYRQQMQGNVEGEVGELRKSLSAQLAETRGAIKQQENARGMLFSGRRQKKEGEAQNIAASTFNQGSADIARGAEQTSEDLYGRASALKSGQQSALAGAQSIVDRAREARNAASQAMGSQFSSLLGEGIGTAAGKYRKSSGNQTMQNTVIKD